MKKILALFFLFVCIPVLAENSISQNSIKQELHQDKPIENLTQYFEYLPNEVHKNWVPYKANSDYEVTVQFRVMKNGDISKPFIVKSTNSQANASVLNAVLSAAPYKPLPKSYSGNGVNTQIELKFIKN